MTHNIQVIIDDQRFDIEVHLDAEGHATAKVAGQPIEVVFERRAAPDPVEWLLVDGRSYEVVIDRQLRWIRTARSIHRLDLHDLAQPGARPHGGDGRVKAPIPGTIARVLVAPGARVELGQPLLVLEAMKMENQIVAPRAGVVERLSAAAGQSVTLGAVLAEIG